MFIKKLFILIDVQNVSARTLIDTEKHEHET